MALSIMNDWMVPEGAVVTYAQNSDGGLAAALLFDGGEDRYELHAVNRGEMHLGFPPGYIDGIFVYFTSALFWDEGGFSNYGLISAITPQASRLRALFAPSWGPDVSNDGRIVAQARDAATGLESWDAKQFAANGLSGLIDIRSGESSIGMWFANGGTVVNHGQILVQATGSERDWAESAYGVMFGFGTVFRASLVNTGLISASDGNPSADGAVAVRYFGNGSGSLVNSGTLRGDVAIWETSGEAYPNPSGLLVENSGSMEGRVILGAGNDSINNSGRVVGAVELGIGSDIWYSAAGEHQGAVFAGEGADGLFGSAAADALNGEAGADVIRGGGGADALNGGEGADIFVYDRIGDSTAGTFDTIAGFASGVDRIDLSALAVQSVSIQPGAGFSQLSAVTSGGTLVVRVEGALTSADLILSAAPSRAGTAASDMLHASAGGSTLTGAGGDDTLIGGAGNDRLDGGAGTDSVWGGPGDDVLVIDEESDAVIELAGQGHDTLEVDYHFPYFVPENVEDVIAVDLQFTYILGNSLGNRMTGNRATNTFLGEGGDDIIAGGDGDDTLQGGAGSDRLTGDAGRDRFVFIDPSDSKSPAQRSDGHKAMPDLITDFVSGQDRIDLSAIDRNPATFEKDPLILIGSAAFTHRAGEIRYDIVGGRAHIQVDMNGDAFADMHIIAVTPSLQAIDFIL